MALTYSPPGELGSSAPDFTLRGVDGKTHRLADFSDRKALVVVFMCNHCPYVQAVQGRINALAKEFLPKGVALIGINPNDAKKYPDDRFEVMQQRARELGFVFPYLQDEDQTVARAYGAVCTPDFYLYENTAQGFLLRYRGRLDDSWKDEKSVKRRDLAVAIDALLRKQGVIGEQPPSMGCSIKWK